MKTDGLKKLMGSGLKNIAKNVYSEIADERAWPF